MTNRVYNVSKVMHKIGKAEYITVSEVGGILGVSPATVRLWTVKSVLKTKRHPVNRYRLYKKEDVTKLLKKIEKGEQL